MKMKSIGLLIFLVCLAVPGIAMAQTPQPPDAPMAGFYDRLAPPPTVYPPTQADQGAQVYYQVCMVCHGDKGQGLTDEWRGALDPADQNCWQSRCHAGNHPADGFIFPKIVPPVVGPQMGARFRNALDLYQYLKTRMPWQWPGTRSDDEYWQLTAHLLRWNGVDPGVEPLTPERAANIWLNPDYRPAATPTPATEPGQQISGGAVLGGLFLGLAILSGLAFLLVKYIIDASLKK
jgi:cytochrome c5